MRVHARRVLVTGVLAAAACTHRVPVPSAPASGPPALEAEFLIPGGATGPQRFGGISGVVPIGRAGELLAISDDRDDSRMFRLRIEREAPGAFRVVPVQSIPLQRAAGAPAKLDPEGIALTGDGHVLISSEGVLEEEPRVGPSISEFTPDGTFVRQLPTPARFIPNERGPLTTGVRPNAGFESLSVSPDFRYLFTANELPLVQDGDDAAVARGEGGRVRLLRYRKGGSSYEPEQELIYELAPVGPLPFTPSFVVNGLVELLAFNGTELLALERAYAQSEGRQQFTNRIRLFRISLREATDVTGIASLRAAGTHRAVRKTLVADLNGLPGLSPSLRNLDNFEALAPITLDPGGPRRLLVVSDDNFSSNQFTAFLLLEGGRLWN